MILLRGWLLAIGDAGMDGVEGGDLEIFLL